MLPLLNEKEVVANFSSVVASSGKPPMENKGVSHNNFDDFFDNAIEITEVTTGWRLEKNSNGYYRWRWQLKDDSGKSITYINNSGKKSYKRGSKYVGKQQL